MADIPQFTIINLLTGFLGSGKTTLGMALLARQAVASGEVEFDGRRIDKLLVSPVRPTDA